MEQEIDFVQARACKMDKVCFVNSTEFFEAGIAL
jgi:hypothetical protein